MLRIATVLICSLFAAPAFAQSPYVAATIGADVSFPTRTETSGIGNPDGDTTAVGAALRLGTSLGSRWGVELVPPQLLALIPVSLRSFHSRSTSDGVGPVVGAEARIAMMEHLRLVPGVRLHSLGNKLTDGWLVRTTVGLGWTF